MLKRISPLVAGIKIPALQKISLGEPSLVRPFVERYTIIDGRRINILVEGRLINLASAEYMATNADKLEKRVCSVPGEIDRAIARLKLEAMGLKTDVLTEEQVMNRGSWEEGL